jgi:hypothetical protein
MAKIPLGDQGFRFAGVAPQVSAPSGAFGGLQAQALQGLGQQVMSTGQQIQRQQEELDRAKSATALANLNNDLNDIHVETDRGVMDGSIGADDAESTFKLRADEAFKARTTGLPKSSQQAMNGAFIQQYGRLNRGVQDTVLKRKQSETRVELDQFGEAAQRQAMSDLPGAIEKYSAVADVIGPNAGLNPQQVAAYKQNFKENATYTFGSNMLMGAAKKGDLGAVDAAIGWLDSDDANVMSPDKRSKLQTSAIGYRNGILAANQRATDKAERERLAREDAGTNVFNKAYDQWSRGQFFDVNFISEASAVVAGTASEAPLRALFESQAQVAGFASQSLPQQRADLERQRAAGATRGVGTNPVALGVYDQQSKINAGLEAAAKENPWKAAQGAGALADAPEISVNNIQDAQRIVGQRMANIGQVERWTGYKISPFQPAEAQEVGKLIRTLPPDQAATALGSFGDMIGDPDRLTAFANQIGDKDKVLATAMAYANTKTTFGRQTSELILRGERALKDGTAKVDAAKETGWRADIAKTIGDATLNQTVRQQWIDSAFLVQAAIYSEGGGTDIQRAVRLATGGIKDQADKTKIPLPYGMNEDTFDQRVKNLQAGDFAKQISDGNVYSGATAIPIEQFVKQLPKASLIHAGPGRYTVRAGNGFMTNAAGQRITIDLNPSRPVASPPNGAQGQPNSFIAVPNPSGILEQGNLDLTKRPQVKNKDGSVSTVRSMSVTFDDGTYLLPTVIGDKVVSEKEAITHFKKTGEHLGKFKTDADADKYAEQLHVQQERMYAPKGGR